MLTLDFVNCNINTNSSNPTARKEKKRKEKCLKFVRILTYLEKKS